MRNNQNKRMRGRNRNNPSSNRGHNPLTRVYESNGPEVKIRGTAHHVAEKYLQLARDAQSSGDPVSAESYYQHAEHYFRLIAVAQEQFRQNQPYPQAQGGGSGNDSRDESNFDESEEETNPSASEGNEPPAFGPRDPQPYLPRDAQFYPPREPRRDQPRDQQRDQPRDQQRDQNYTARPQQNAQPRPSDDNAPGLPSFITGGQPQPAAPAPGNGPNGFDGNGGGDRFPLHRRRRRHRGPRTDLAPTSPETGQEQDEAGDEA